MINTSEIMNSGVNNLAMSSYDFWALLRENLKLMYVKTSGSVTSKFLQAS